MSARQCRPRSGAGSKTGVHSASMSTDRPRDDSANTGCCRTARTARTAPNVSSRQTRNTWRASAWLCPGACCVWRCTDHVGEGTADEKASHHAAVLLPRRCAVPKNTWHGARKARRPGFESPRRRATSAHFRHGFGREYESTRPPTAKPANQGRPGQYLYCSKSVRSVPGRQAKRPGRQRHARAVPRLVEKFPRALVATSILRVPRAPRPTGH